VDQLLPKRFLFQLCSAKERVNHYWGVGKVNNEGEHGRNFDILTEIKYLRVSVWRRAECGMTVGLGGRVSGLKKHNLRFFCDQWDVWISRGNQGFKKVEREVEGNTPLSLREGSRALTKWILPSEKVRTPD